MIIASIFAFFYFCLCPDARNHRQSIPDSPPFFMFPCSAVFLICTGFSLPEFQPNFVPHNGKTAHSIFDGICQKCVLTVYCTYERRSVQCCLVVEQFTVLSYNNCKHVFQSSDTSQVSFYQSMSCERCSLRMVLTSQTGWFSHWNEIEKQAI